MALLTKDKVNQFGVTEEYWRILNINLNMQYKYCDITIGGYANQESRDNGSEPMNIRKVRAKWDEQEFAAFFSVSAINEGDDNIYNRAYDYIKYKDNYFKDAINC